MYLLKRKLNCLINSLNLVHRTCYILHVLFRVVCSYNKLSCNVMQSLVNLQIGFIPIHNLFGFLRNQIFVVYLLCKGYTTYYH